MVEYGSTRLAIAILLEGGLIVAKEETHANIHACSLTILVVIRL